MSKKRFRRRCVRRCPRQKQWPLRSAVVFASSQCPLGGRASRRAEAPRAEVITVTGSRLRRDAFNSVSPVQLITREEVTAAGFSSATEALQSTGVTTGGAQINNAFGGFVTDGGPGANTLSLRGLGPERTLILINGRRVAPSGTRGAVGSADLNVLPNAIIDHIEILKDGASSIYGSDAIAGVVNIVTLDDIEGVTFEAQYNSPLDGGGEQGRVSVVGGCGGDRWSFGGSLEFYDRSELTLADRDWTHATDMLRDPVTGASLDFIDPLTGPAEVLSDHGHRLERRHDQHDRHEPAGSQASARPARVGTAFNRWRPNPAVTTGLPRLRGRRRRREQSQRARHVRAANVEQEPDLAGEKTRRLPPGGVRPRRRSATPSCTSISWGTAASPSRRTTGSWPWTIA